jgi:phage shock protein A
MTMAYVTRLEKVRGDIADLAIARERVEAQITVLADVELKLRAQQAQASKMGRPDLAEVVAGRIRLADEQISELAAQQGTLREQIRKLAETAQRLEARIPRRR